MAQPSLKMTTLAISVAGILAVLCLLGASGDLKNGNWGGVIVYSLPSLILACLGTRSTSSKKLPIILLVSACVSTALGILVAYFFMGTSGIDAQSGLLVGIVFLIQLGIVAVATVCFLILRKG